MARLGRLGFLGLAVVFHLVYIYSIFDIYFVSPIVRGMKAHSVEQPRAPAKRLVLYVGDGLRADKAFQYFPDPSPGIDTSDPATQEPRPMAPYLRSRVLEHGTFGVSHTRVPTESRPGHVALIAGLYEDVAAVTTGWKLNPVNFDSVFNRSRHTWSWGSPDILPMFSTGAVPGRVTDATYGAEFEDAGRDALELDTWVFDRVKALFKEAETNAELSHSLRQDQNVFFLHLLGLDTNGHANRPYSREYLHNIQVVDQGVREITETVEKFFGDDETAFIFTADHGMSDWGSHGDGHPDNTRTPLIVWGAGVAKPNTVKQGFAPGHEDGFSHDWHLDHVQRHDVAQADVAALMAYLVGIEFPVNSVGELPLSFLDATDEQKAKALLVNAKEILEMYLVKEAQKQETALRYQPFPGFADSEHSIPTRIAAIEQLIEEGSYQQAIATTTELIKLGVQGLRYLQTYAWLFLRTLVTAGYLGWIAYALTTAVDVYMLDGQFPAARTLESTLGFSALLVGLYAVLFVQSSPLTYYVYPIFPVMFWEEVFAARHAWREAKKRVFAKMTAAEKTKLGINAVVFVALLEVMTQSYYHREIYTICYLLAAGWPVFYGADFLRQNAVLCATWALACASMSVFTLLPAIKVEDPNLILIGGGLVLLLGLTYIAFEKSLLVQATPVQKGLASTKIDNLSRTIFGVQVGLVALSMIVTRSSIKYLQAKQGLPLGTQMVGWATLILSLTVPFLHALAPKSHYLHRIAVIFLAFGPCFVILTISYEGLFYFAIAVTLSSWVRLEHRIQQHFAPPMMVVKSTTTTDATKAAAKGTGATEKPGLHPTNYRNLHLSDARICLFFLYLLQSGFFSTGNIASVSSFSLEAVYRLIPVFDPFGQGALLVLKLLAPFVLVSANLGLLTRRLRLRGGALFAVVMAIADYLTLRFFWLVRDEGSWLEIGESISMFVIVSVLCVFVAGLEALSELLIRGVEFADAEDAPLGTPVKKAAEAAQGKGTGNGRVKSR